MPPFQMRMLRLREVSDFSQVTQQRSRLGIYTWAGPPIPACLCLAMSEAATHAWHVMVPGARLLIRLCGRPSVNTHCRQAPGRVLGRDKHT